MKIPPIFFPCLGLYATALAMLVDGCDLVPIRIQVKKRASPFTYIKPSAAMPMQHNWSGKDSLQVNSGKPFRIWASSCSHVGRDINPPSRIKNAMPRESLAEAIRQSEGTNNDGAPSFEWDIAMHLGDFSAAQSSPTDDEGEEVIRQFTALRNHRREQFYCVAGNHDATGPDQSTQWWFRKWIDPTSENREFSGVDPEQRPYPVNGNWERYYFQVGNILFLMMSDRNDGGPPVGRKGLGGYPAGAVTGETFEWWKRMVENNQDKVIVSAHHHMLRETTVASGPWEGFRNQKDEQSYHGYFQEGAPKGASYLYFVDGQPDAQAFEKYLAEHPGAIDIWLGGHTHAKPGDTRGGRSHIEKKWGVIFINVANLTLLGGKQSPKSRLLMFVPGSKEVKVGCYLHSDHFARRGWHAPSERTIQISQPFSWTTP